ncbi:MAG: zinc ribbon domain-containing protein [Anaerolineae bacterium]
MAWPQALIRLQEIDRELAEHRRRLEAIASELQQDSAVREAERTAESCAEAAREARQAQQELEFELSQVQTKREREEQNLYSGRITNSRELQDLQAEIQSLRRRISSLEDELLEAMMEREAADEAASAAQERLQETRARIEAQQAHLIEERAELETTDEALRAERAKLAEQIPPAILDTYEHLWDRTGGMPVAQLNGEVCSVCGTVVLRMTRRKVSRGEEAYCDTCGRLLVA